MRPFATVAALLIVAAALFAQGAGGTLTGIVTGPTGAPVADAPIQAKNRQSGAVVRAASSADGRYRLAPIPAGAYDISITMPCCAYAPFVQQNVAMAAGQARQLDVRLAEGLSFNTAGDDPGELAAALRKRQKVPSRPVPRLAGKPDFSGVWLANEDRYPEQPALLPWAAKALQERLGNNLKDAPHTQCLPQGIPTPSSIGPFMAKMVQTPALLVVLFEDTGGFRQVFIDGRPHPQDPDPSWVGHSIGNWDGDMLIVDTIGYNDQSWIGIFPHSEMLHVTERIRRPDFGHLDIRVTLDDPGAFSTPWHQTLNWELLPAEDVVAYVCENNKAQHLVGR